jgi:hypothetical protein
MIQKIQVHLMGRLEKKKKEKVTLSFEAICMQSC